MSFPAGPHFFVSYSRADIADLRRIVTELRKRGVNAWVDTENLIPGSPEWEREIERSIRSAAGVIVLLSPSSNDSQWVRRELSFAEEIDKRLFPVHVRGDENDSIPLRLAAHQRVDLRSNFSMGLDRLADALNDHLGTTKVIERSTLKPQQSFNLPSSKDLKKLALPVGLVSLALLCISGMTFAVRAISNIRIPTATSPIIVNTPTQVKETSMPTETGVTPVVDSSEPTGKIVYTCTVAGGDELCIINADGTGQRQLTDSYRSSNATVAPDGKSIVYVMDNGKNTEVYEMDLASGKSTQLTDLKKSVGSPEISPDNRYIIFHYYSGKDFQLWIMDRDGSNPHKFLSESGRDTHDATWSPDGTKILFALGKGDNNKLYSMDFKGGEPKLLNDSIDTRGRSDWSINDFISFDQGGPFLHDVYLMDIEGNDLHRVSPSGLNAQGASLSPDGNWIAFTGYTDVKNKDQNSCEIFIMRVDGSDMRQLTKNTSCDYQPRWGN